MQEQICTWHGCVSGPGDGVMNLFACVNKRLDQIKHIFYNQENDY